MTAGGEESVESESTYTRKQRNLACSLFPELTPERTKAEVGKGGGGEREGRWGCVTRKKEKRSVEDEGNNNQGEETKKSV